MKKKLKNGFTLIELLIVVAIIAILAAIAVPNFLEAQTRAKVSRAQADMRTIATCIESYYVDNNKYPPFGAPITANNTCGGITLGGGKVFIIADSTTGVRDAAGNPNCGVSSRLIWITTPIAYCSSILPEAFNVKNATLTGISGADPLEYDTYDFFAAQNVTPGGLLGGGNDMRGASLTSGAQWRLSSAGPDNIQAFGGSSTAAGTGPMDSNTLGADYDSSNGTISAGDIVRVGGGRGPLFTLRPYYYRVGNTLTSINNMPPIQ